MNDPDTNNILSTLTPHDETTAGTDSDPRHPDFKDNAFAALVNDSEVFAQVRQDTILGHAAPERKANARPARQKNTDHHTAPHGPGQLVSGQAGRLLSEIIGEIPMEERLYVLEKYQEGICKGAIRAVVLQDGSGEYMRHKVYYYGDQGRTHRTVREEYVIITQEQKEWTRLQRTASRQHRMRQTGKVWAVLSDVLEGSVDIELLADIRRETALRDAGTAPKRRSKS